MKRITFLVIVLVIALCCSCRYIHNDGFTAADQDEIVVNIHNTCCLLYTSDAADD